MKRRVFAYVVGLSASAAMAQTLPPEQAFGAREAVTSARLSPDGKTMAFLAPTPGQGNALFTVPVDGNSQPVRVVAASGDPERLTGCGWVGNDRLACEVYTLRSVSGFLVDATRQIAVDSNGGNLRVIEHGNGGVVDWLPGQNDNVLMVRWRGGWAVEKVDTRTGNWKPVLAPMTNTGEYITDGLGNVRIAGVTQYTGNDVTTGQVKYFFRAKGGTEWKPLSVFDGRNNTGFNPFTVDPVDDVAYGFEKQNGRLALVSYKLDNTNTRKLIFARDDVDIDGLVRLGRKRRVIGTTFATEKRQARYFDPAMERLAASLSKALPGSPIINIEGASDDEQKLLIWAGSDTDPGRYFILDRATKQMRPLLLNRPELSGYKLATVKSIEVKAADGVAIPAYLTLPPAPQERDCR